MKRYFNIRELMEYTGLGRNRARDLGEAAGAVRRVGRRVLYDVTAIDHFFDHRRELKK